MHNIYAFSIYVLDIDTAFVIEKKQKVDWIGPYLKFFNVSMLGMCEMLFFHTNTPSLIRFQ